MASSTVSFAPFFRRASTLPLADAAARSARVPPLVLTVAVPMATGAGVGSGVTAGGGVTLLSLDRRRCSAGVATPSAASPMAV